MSTSGCVAVGNLEQWKGIMCLHDAYPISLGIKVLNKIEEKTLDVFCGSLLNFEGWFDRSNSWSEYGDYLTSKKINPMSIEYVYIVNRRERKVHILKSFCILLGEVNLTRDREVTVFKRKESFRGIYYGCAVYWYENIDSVSLDSSMKIYKMKALQMHVKTLETLNRALTEDILIIEKIQKEEL